MSDRYRILFVCLGNICRSPAAEEVLRVQAARVGWGDRIAVDSAGTYAGHAGQLPDQRMQRAARARGYALRHLARPVRAADFDRFDRIVAMDDSVYERLHRLAPDREAAARIRRMADYIPDPAVREVPDPYYEAAQGFERVLDLLEAACPALLAEAGAPPSGMAHGRLP